MLFAVDIDGVCATYMGTDAIGAYVREVMHIPIAAIFRVSDFPGMTTQEALLQDPVYATWYKEKGEPKEHVDKMLIEAQYSPVVQERAVPLRGSAEALTHLAGMSGNHIIYITNRKQATWQVTSDWLARSGFPSFEKLYCCGGEMGFYGKVKYAIGELESSEQLVFIDDMAKYYEYVFARLIKENPRFVPRYLRRLAVIRFGSPMAPPCPYRYPTFPLAPMPRWDMIDHTLAVLIPFIGADCRDFFKEGFEPGLLRRTPITQNHEGSAILSNT